MLFICFIFSIIFFNSHGLRISTNIVNDTVFKLTNSPIIITNNITISKGVRLTIEPGVIVQSFPKVKISVIGELIARGTVNQRIVFTKHNNAKKSIKDLKIQLVEGNEYREGKLNVFYGDKWRPVCSQNQEWSSNDISVACKELGFLRGNFSLNGRAENDSSHVLLKKPNCKGTENSISECSGYQNMKIGSIVCNLEELVGLHCWGANPEYFDTNWWGITMYNSTITEKVFGAGNTRLNVSSSILEYVDILYAGVNVTNHRVAALSASPYPPKLNNVRLAYNAYDAVNFTDIRGPAHILNSVIENNQGHGLNITSSVGYVHLSNVQSHQNTGTGGYLRMTTKHWSMNTPEVVDEAKKICGGSVIPNSLPFPFYLLLEHPVPLYSSSGSCRIKLNTDRNNQIISIRLLETILDRTASASIQIIDLSTKRQLLFWNFTYNTIGSRMSTDNRLVYGPLYQGVSSIGQNIEIIFNWKKISKQRFCPFMKECFRALIQFSVAESTNPEILVENSKFEKNLQQGLRIENLGLYGKILNSKFVNNQFGAGLQILNGSSDLLIHRCYFNDNHRTGLNISTAGGIRIINESYFHNNQGHGLDIWNPDWSMTRIPKLPIKNVVYHSTFQGNFWNGIRFFNSSVTMDILVNRSRFVENMKNGIEMISTIIKKNKFLTNFTAGDNYFKHNQWHGISISPIGQMIGSIHNSTFESVPYIKNRYGTNVPTGGAISIDNGVDFEEQRLLYRNLYVDYKIFSNKFLGKYDKNKYTDDLSSEFIVKVRLSEGSSKQNCLIRFNIFDGNKIVLSNRGINPRNYMPAVITIGSSNVRVIRNVMRNPASRYEIASHLQSSNSILDATRNYWGNEKKPPPDSSSQFSSTKNINWEQIHARIFERIFDRISRYTLSKIEYYPVLKDGDDLHSSIDTSNYPIYRLPFTRKSSLDGNTELGGWLEIGSVSDPKNVLLPKLTENSIYRVTRDIFVPLGSHLTVDEGVAIEFENSVGLFSQGSITMKSTTSSPIKLGLNHRSISNRNILPDIRIVTKSQIQNITAAGGNYSSLIMTNTTVDMTNMTGVEGISGVVLVRINDQKWRTVCGDGIDLIGATIMCSSMGLVAHPQDWKLPPNERIRVLQTAQSNNQTNPNMISALRCQKWQTHLSQCQFDDEKNVNRSICNEGILNIRCHKPGWTGIRIGTTQDLSILNNIHISNAGLLDYRDNQFVPGLQIDFNKHQLGNIQIDNGLADGLVIIHNDAVQPQSITNMHTHHNLGNGLVLRSPWLHLSSLVSHHNHDAGLSYDSRMTEEQLYQYRSMMTKTQKLVSNSLPASESVNVIGVHPSGLEVLYMDLGKTNETKVYWSEIKTTDLDKKHQLLLSLIDYNPDTKVEKVTIYDNTYKQIQQQLANPKLKSSSITFKIPEDLPRFPLLSNGPVFTISVTMKGISSGRLTFLVQSRVFFDKPYSKTANLQLPYPITYVQLDKSRLYDNKHGVSISNYNTATDSRRRAYNMRHSWLNVSLTNSEISRNKQHGLFVHSVSPYSDDMYSPADINSNARISMIQYTLRNDTFQNNQGSCILAQHIHTPYSNNIWDYTISGNRFYNNINDGFEFQIPFVSREFDWRYISDVKHRMLFESNKITNNKNFRFLISGYFMELIMNKNKINNNNCGTKGLIELKGMEKKFRLLHNEIRDNNQCEYVIKNDINSQIEVVSDVMGFISRNVIKNNDCDSSTTKSILKCYAIGIFGNQNASINRNIIMNPQYNYELIAGILSSNIDAVLNAQYNYWGTANNKVIVDRIFDSYRWNNFAEVDYSRYLLVEDVNTAKVYMGVIKRNEFSISQVNVLSGGKISGTKILSYNRQGGYIVDYDITVLPGSKLIIEPGVTLYFKPNIGILVFGQLVAKGTKYRPITMTAYYNKTEAIHSYTSRMKRETLQSNKVMRFVGGMKNNEGFLQLYNKTAMRWDYVCDKQFSRHNAHVSCRQMGLDSGNNIQLRRTYLLDFRLYGHDNPFITKHVWHERYACTGDESRLDGCTHQFNYNSQLCLENREFIFIRCGKENHLQEGEQYWGNIRIVLPELEQKSRVDSDTHRSILEHVTIVKAGRLHNEFVPAVQSIYGFFTGNFLRIRNCAWNGVDIVAPRKQVHISNSSFHGNIGYGWGLTILNSDSSDPLANKYQQMIPLAKSPLTSSIVSGLLDVCDIKKEWTLDKRLLIYYRYSYRPTACTKLIRSVIPNRQIAIRFLQLHLYYDPFTKNIIKLYNGFNFNITESLADIEASSRSDTGGEVTMGATGTKGKSKNDDKKNMRLLPSLFTKSGYDAVGINLHASPASDEHGFIMELVALPISPDAIYLDDSRYTEHQITQSEFSNNQHGANRLSVVGVSNPKFNIYYNRFMNNGDNPPILNLTSAPTSQIRLLNCKEVNIGNNYWFNNTGTSIDMELYSTDLNNAVRVNFTNNVLTKNSHGSIISVKGNYISTGKFSRNYISENNCENRDLISIHGALMKSFSHNYITNNVASVMLNTSGGELSDYSNYEWNGFYDNLALNFTRSTTIYCDNSKNKFRFNYFRNMRNNYELTVGNRTIMKKAPILGGSQCDKVDHCSTGWQVVHELDQCVCYRDDKLDARQNWWGENKTFYIASKIWQHDDDKYLIPVDYSSPVMTNKTVLDGSLYCPPTWKYVNNNCYFYFGAPVTFKEAKQFCRKYAGAIVANIDRNHSWLQKMIIKWQNNYDWLNKYSYNTRAWVHSHVPFTQYDCSVVRYKWLEGYDCNKNVQFVCQKSPYGIYKPVQQDFVISMAVISFLILAVIILLIILWVRNSRRRSKALLLRLEQLKHSLGSAQSPIYDAEYRKRSLVTGTLPSAQFGYSSDPYYSTIDNAAKQTLPSIHSNVTTTTTKSKAPLLAGGTGRKSRRYEDDLVEMRRNTLNDDAETIYKPKASTVSSSGSIYPVHLSSRMTNPKHGHPKNQQPLILAYQAPPTLERNSRINLPQPEVPTIISGRQSQTDLMLDDMLMNPDDNRGTIRDARQTGGGSKWQKPSEDYRNPPVIHRSTHDLRSVSRPNSVSSQDSSQSNYNPRMHERDDSKRRIVSPSTHSTVAKQPPPTTKKPKSRRQQAPQTKESTYYSPLIPSSDDGTTEI